MYIRLERHVNDVIIPNSNVIFDQVLNMSTTEENPDFLMLDDGSIQILQPGDYVVRFMTNQMTGLSADGNYFSAMYRKYRSTAPNDWEWVSIGGGGDEESLATDSITCMASVPKNLTPEQPFIVALRNVTSSNVKLSPHDHVKASMLIFASKVLEGQQKSDVESLVNDLDEYEAESAIFDLPFILERLEKMENWQNRTLSDLNEALEEFIEKYTYYYKLRGYSEYQSEKIRGMTVCSIAAGYVYHFWFKGVIESNVTFPTSGEKLIIVDSSLCTPMQIYQGEPSISACLCKSDTVNKWIPVYFDNTGIYFINPPQDCLVPGVTLSFTQAFILG